MAASPDDLLVLLDVVREGSFSAAAQRRATHPSHVSRVVKRLEADLEASVLNRTTRTLSPTEFGLQVIAHAQAIERELQAVANLAIARSEGPRGLLRVTCGQEYGTLAVNGWITSFLARWPHVRVDARFTNRVVDLVREGFDLGIRVGRLADSDLRARRLGSVSFGFFAPPALAGIRVEDLHSAPAVASVQSWKDDAWAVLGPAGPTRLRAQVRYVTDNHAAALAAAAEGVGLTHAPQFQARPYEADGRLVRVLEDYGGEPIDVWAVYPASAWLAPNVRAFVQHAAEALTEP